MRHLRAEGRGDDPAIEVDLNDVEGTRERKFGDVYRGYRSRVRRWP
jgi:hypothetical protein